MRPVGLSPLSASEWRPRRLKFYPHFDRFLSGIEANNLATNPSLVAKHAFFPFLSFEDKWKKFGSSGPRKLRVKSRPILYAARSDSYIYEYYREILSRQYEKKLHDANIAHIAIAYRKLCDATGRSCSNIDFAREVFEEIGSRAEGVAIALDISKFFENIDHGYLKNVWMNLLDVPRLPPDHFAVYRSITKYSKIDKKKLYNILGIQDSSTKKKAKQKTANKVGYQICDLKYFREKLRYDKVADGDLLQKNTASCGIPQGSPISDLLANAVMFEFDKKCFEFCSQYQGYYRRYSDDIVFVLPNRSDLINEIQSNVSKWLKEISLTLEISSKKTRIHEFSTRAGRKTISAKTAHRCPFEYLGFQFDGRHALFRNSTLSSLSRRIKTTAHAIAHTISKRYKLKSIDELMQTIDISQFLQRFFRIANFSGGKNYTEQSFWSYARLAERRMGSLGIRLLRQIAGLKKVARQSIEKRLREIRGLPPATILFSPQPPAPAPAA